MSCARQRCFRPPHCWKGQENLPTHPVSTVIGVLSGLCMFVWSWCIFQLEVSQRMCWVYLSLSESIWVLGSPIIPIPSDFPKSFWSFLVAQGDSHRASQFPGSLHRVPERSPRKNRRSSIAGFDRHGSRAQPTIQRDAHRCAERSSGADDIRWHQMTWYSLRRET